MLDEIAPAPRRTGRELTLRGAAALAACWMVAAAAAFPLADAGGMQFLGVSLGAYLAGQGALVFVVLAGLGAVSQS